MRFFITRQNNAENNKKIRAVTELWNLESGTGRIIDPELEANKYAYGIGLFLVNPDFCNN